MQRIFSARTLVIGLSVLALSACGKAPAPSAYLNRGGPESLLDVSSEVVTLNANSSKDLQELSSWIERDQPTRAELNCLAGDKYCTESQKVLDLYGVPASAGMAGTGTVTLVYERILARDCSSSYVDNRDNFYNTNHASFGCANAANMVQQVTNKQSFINPNLSDDPSAVRAVNDIHRAYAPREIVKPYSIDQSIVGKAKSE